MAATNYDACFAEMERWEGWHKFTITPHDPGGATYCGLTQAAYTAWRTKQRLPRALVQEATDEEIGDIFHDQYWMPVLGNDLWAGLDLMVFDISVNMGPPRAAKILQRAVGAVPDGWVGMETLGAVQRSNDREAVLARVHAGRLGFWRSLGTWLYFGTGWTNRENDIFARAKAMLAASTGVVTAAHA